MSKRARAVAAAAAASTDSVRLLQPHTPAALDPQIGEYAPPSGQDAPMYVPPWPGLRAGHLFSVRRDRQAPYPFNMADRNKSAFCVARSGIYHLFRALKFQPGETVLVPDYHSGNEVAAIKAAGATIVYYPIRKNLEPDMDKLSELASRGPKVIYVIHYLGWPQPMTEMRDLCRRSGALLVEDCALALLSEHRGIRLGAYGDYSVFCLYKTLPVPNGGLLVRNTPVCPELDVDYEPCPPATATGRTAELMLEAVRSDYDRIGRTFFALKHTMGRMLRSAHVRSVPVGDIGWNPANVNVAMTPLSNHIVKRLDYEDIRRKRRENFCFLRDELQGVVTMLREDLEPGVCPLFFPILVRKKHAVADALRQRGIQAVEFWNDTQRYEIGRDARYLRASVLEIPIHQGVRRKQLEYIVRQVKNLRPEPAPAAIP